MAGRSTHTLQATCEDYHSDESETVESFRRSPINTTAANQANVTAKRSHPSDLGSDQPQAAEKAVNVNIDLQSDSGYSSHTAATMSSADSAPSAKSQSPPIAAVNMNGNTGPRPPASPVSRRERERRPTMEDRKSSRADRAENSPRKPLARSGSVSTRQPTQRRPTLTRGDRDRDDIDCTDPDCTKCGPNVRGRRPAPLTRDSGLDVSYPAFEQREQRSRRDSYVPQSPTYTTRRPPAYYQDQVVVQPARTMPRRSSSTTRPQRPVSYHADSTQNYPWYQTPPPERGPPPSQSAIFSMQHLGPQQPPQMNMYGMMGTPPNYYPPNSIQQVSPPYDSQRPPMTRAPSSQYNTRRPTSQYGAMLPPIVTQQDPNLPSARHGQLPQQPQSARFDRVPTQPNWDDDSSSEYDSEDDNDRAIMPPPKKPAARRPSVPRAKTTPQVYDDDRMSRSMMLPERPKERDPRASRVATNPAPSRSTSTARRPPLKPKAPTYESPRAQVFVENSRSQRRQSYMGHEKEPELRAKHRDSKIYQEEPRAPKITHGERSDAIALSGHRRRQTDTDSRRRDESMAESKLNAAERYQQQTRGSEAPLIDQVNKAAKRSSRIINGDARSRHSDEGSRISRSNRTAVTSSGNNGEVRLRVDPSMGLSLQLNGDHEGRTIQLNPGEDGMAEIVISGPRGGENTYRSERGSVAGSRRAIMPRREAEDTSTRSTRSSQTRRERDREGERRPLRRRREIEYEE